MDFDNKDLEQYLALLRTRIRELEHTYKQNDKTIKYLQKELDQKYSEIRELNETIQSLISTIEKKNKLVFENENLKTQIKKLKNNN